MCSLFTGIMGCLKSKHNQQTLNITDSEEPPKQYSWDKRPKIDPKDFTIENLNNETVCKLPGSLNGQQFIIQSCQNSNIYIFDHTVTISVDECVNCRIFLGPIKTSVFIRDCKDCKFMLACQQFRTRDCQRLDVFLSCGTQPIIEASTGIKMGCFQFNYPELENQFKSAELSIFNNNWSNVHDFTPVPGENNYSLISQDMRVEDCLPLPDAEKCNSLEISSERERSVVPYTTGSRRKTSDQGCLVVFFNDGMVHDRTKRFLQEMATNHQGCVLVQSKEFMMQPADAERVFSTDSYTMAVQRGPVIGVEFNGDGCCEASQETLMAVAKGSTGLVFVSSSPQAAAQQIENFYNYADMQMAV